MQRYFFHILHSEHRVEDPEGSEFASLGAAQEEAVATLRDLVADALMDGKPSKLMAIEIADETEAVLASVDIDAAIRGVLLMVGSN
jgi:hypothetical protein